MKINRQVTVYNCDVCGKEVLAPDGTWLRLTQPRHEQSVDSIQNLDFCSRSCLEKFVNADVAVYQDDQFVNGLASFIIGDRR